MTRRVVVTGLGAVSPVGNDVPSTWTALLEGRSGITRITRFDASPFDYDVAAEVKGFDPTVAASAKEARRMDLTSQYGLVAALEAARDAGLLEKAPLGPGAGVVFGAAGGGYTLMEEQRRVLQERGARRLSPFFLTNLIPDAVSGHIAIALGAMGPNMAVIAACATGAGAIGEAAEVIRRGDADVMVAGGTEAPLVPLIYASFCALRAVGTGDPDDPRTASRPFDRRRDGFVVGEGAACLVLESADHAERRRARVYAELVGYGSSNDAFDMVASEDGGRGPVLAIEMALRKAAIDRTAIGYVNAHGTGTPLNDRVETAALKRVFGDHARSLAVSSTKSMTGHLMGAAGALEAVVSVLALRDQVLPPTINYGEPDPDCDLDYVPNAARRVAGLQAVLSNSIGLGGHNAALIFGRYA